jgi:hypothetical protein
MDRPGVTRNPDFSPSLPLFFRELSPGHRGLIRRTRRTFFSLVVSLATCPLRLCPQRAMTR